MFEAYKNFGFNSLASDTAGNGIISETSVITTEITFVKPTLCKKS